MQGPLAAGSGSVNNLVAIVEAKDIPCEVIGDAGQIGMAFDAVHQGFAAGKDL